MKIKFVEDGNNANTKIILDGKELEKVISFKFNASVGKTSTVLLEIAPSEIEIESESFKLTTDDFTVEDMMEAMSQEVGKSINIEPNVEELSKIISKNINNNTSY